MEAFKARFFYFTEKHNLLLCYKYPCTFWISEMKEK